MRLGRLLLVSLPLVACSKEADTGVDLGCASACERAYDPDQCGTVRAGKTQDELIATCLDTCRQAMSVEGEMGSYDPNTPLAPGDSTSLLNATQAEAWMACVRETRCEEFYAGYCAPL
jgi:hypothetical protein